MNVAWRGIEATAESKRAVISREQKMSGRARGVIKLRGKAKGERMSQRLCAGHSLYRTPALSYSTRTARAPAHCPVGLVGVKQWN